jgi:hypothetical protein
MNGEPKELNDIRESWKRLEQNYEQKWLVMDLLEDTINDTCAFMCSDFQSEYKNICKRLFFTYADKEKRNAFQILNALQPVGTDIIEHQYDIMNFFCDSELIEDDEFIQLKDELLSLLTPDENLHDDGQVDMPSQGLLNTSPITIYPEATDFEIDHVLIGTQITYGYLWWGRRNNPRFQQIFPDGYFSINIGGKKHNRKKVDWQRARLSIGSPLRKNFKVNDRIKISKQLDGNVSIKKIGEPASIQSTKKITKDYAPRIPETLSNKAKENYYKSTEIDIELFKQIALHILRIDKVVKQNQFKSEDLKTALDSNGQSFSIEQIKQTVDFLSSPPFQMFIKDDAMFRLSADIHTIVDKINIMSQILKQIDLPKPTDDKSMTGESFKKKSSVLKTMWRFFIGLKKDV